MYSDLHTGVIQIESSLTSAEAAEIAAMPHIHTIQFAAALEASAYIALENDILASRPELAIRAYGFYDHICDLSFVKKLPSLRILYIECTEKFSHLEDLASLQKLEELHLRLNQLDSFDILRELPEQLRVLTLGSTISKKPSLQDLGRFQQLEQLSLDGHTKHIEQLTMLKQLRQLTLRSVTLKDLSMLQILPALKSLRLQLGGTTSLEALAELNQLHYLELIQIKGLDTLDFISSMTGLQYIRIEAIPRIHQMPDLQQLVNLRKINLSNMKGLRHLDTLQYAPALVEFIHREAWEMVPEQYLPLLKNPSLQRAYVHLRNEKRMTAFHQMLHEYGKKDAAEEAKAQRESWITTDFPFE